MDDGDGVFVGDEDAAFAAVCDADAEVMHASGAAKADLEKTAQLLKGAKKPILLIGKTDWTQEGWNNRIALAERLGRSEEHTSELQSH